MSSPNAPFGRLPSAPAMLVFCALIMFLFGVWIFGQIMRERTWLSSLCFLFPSVFAAALTFLAGAAALFWRLWRVSLVAAFGSFWPLIFMLTLEMQWSPSFVPETVGPSWRIVHAQFSGGEAAWPETARDLASWNADLCLVSGRPGGSEVPALGAGLACVQAGEFTLTARGTLAVGETFTSGLASATVVRWRVDEREWKLLVVAFPASIWVAREPLLEWLAERMVGEKPDLVVGDFHTPRRAWAFERPPKGYRGAYEQGGAGWCCTWPASCPLWALDQCLVGPTLKAWQYGLAVTPNCSHRTQVLDVMPAPKEERSFLP